jgi:hypothetical protein
MLLLLLLLLLWRLVVMVRGSCTNGGASYSCSREWICMFPLALCKVRIICKLRYHRTGLLRRLSIVLRRLRVLLLLAILLWRCDRGALRWLSVTLSCTGLGMMIVLSRTRH